MKILLAVSVILLLGSSLSAVSLYQENRSQQSRLDDYQDHVQQLLSQVEEISRNRLDYEKQLAQLSSDLTRSNSQLISLSNQLQAAEDQADPDYAELENTIRARLAAEFSQQNNAQTGSTTALLRQLSAMDKTEFSTLISMQGRYGEFLNSLNVSDQRMDVIIAALTNMVEQQNSAQQQLMEQQMQVRTDQITELQASGGNRQEIRERLQNINFGQMQQQIAEIYSPEAQRDALAFDLTDEELSAFADFQENQQQYSMSVFDTADGFTGFKTIINDTVTDPQGGTGTAMGIRVIQATPR